MKPVDLARKLRRDAAFEPEALDRGKEALMAAIRQEAEPTVRPTIIPQLPYADIRAALSFLERAFGFREVPASRMEGADGVIHHSLVEFGGGSLTKVRLLLDRLDRPAGFVPVDVSGGHLHRSADDLRRRYPGLEVLPVVADFTADVPLPRPARPQDRARQLCRGMDEYHEHG